MSFEDDDEQFEEEALIIVPKKKTSSHEFKKVNKTRSGFSVSTKKKTDNLKSIKRSYQDEDLAALKKNVENMYNEDKEVISDFEEVIRKKTFKNENDEIETQEYTERIPKEQISKEKNSTKIMDEFSIQNAKLKRMKAQNEENFIPLEKEDENETKESQSSDEDDEEIFDEHKGKKIKFGMTTEKKKISNLMEIESSESSNSEDEDDKEWEELQLQNAGFNVLKKKKRKKIRKD